MATRRKRLGEILVSWGTLTEETLKEGLEYAKSHSRRLGDALVEMELVTEDDICKALATQFDMEYVDLDHNVITPGAIELLPEELIRRHQVLPMGQQDGRLKVIITDPLDLEVLDVLRFRIGSGVSTALAPATKVSRLIDAFLAPTMSDSIDETVQELANFGPDMQAPQQAQAIQLEDEDDDAPIIRLVNLVVGEAVRTRASDIHIEPFADRVRVRYRIDGVCVERDPIPKPMQSAITSRLKIMSGMDIAERRVPQDGRIKMRFADSDVDFRVSALPHYHGESVVLRVLRPDSVKVGIQALGFEDVDYERFLQIIRKPNGIFLVTGPTGSGKTTTLYAALQELNRPDTKIITAEDPVEYNFPGMNQCQVRDSIGFGFAEILRSMLRQAPNIILVGEIRDVTVGEVATQAALTGHLVFSTLHTNDAPSAITRLIDMGIKAYMVASSVQAVLAQRLIRVICQDCKEPEPDPDPRLLKILSLTPEELEGRTLYRGAGCPRCGYSGYHGRQGIFELMEMNSEIRELAFDRAPGTEIRKASRATGMRTLLDDGKLKILTGVTSVSEIARITQTQGVIQVDDENEG